MSEEKQKTHWINWLIPSLLVFSAFLVLFFYNPDPVKTNLIETPTGPSQTSVNTDTKSGLKNIANSLVSTYFNGSDEDVADQQIALQNTISTLAISENPQAKRALAQLKSNNINDAIKTLIKFSTEQGNLNKSAKIWIDIGNIQNLTSAGQALQAYKKASDFDASNSTAWSRQGNVYRQLKQFDKAEAAYKKVQALGNQDIANEAFSLVNFGLLNQSRGDLVEAEKAFKQALAIYTRIENEAGIASTSEHLASLYKNSEQFEKAETHYLKALEIRQKLEQPQNISTIHNALGSVYQTMKLGNKAQTQYEKALEINLNNNFTENVASLYSNLGTLAQQNGQLEKSKIYFEKSLELNKDNKRSNSTADQYGNLAILNRNKKEFDKAESFHLQAIEIYQHNNNINGVISQRINLGFLYKVWQKNDKACNVWRGTLPTLKQTRSSRLQRVEELIAGSCQ